MIKDIRFFILLSILLLSGSNLNAQFQRLETKNLRLIYLGKPHEFVVPYLARCFENSLKFQENLFNYSTDEKVTVLLTDFSDYFNAGATAVPRNFMKLELAPTNYIYETTPANERLNFTISHELIHVVSTDKMSGSDDFFRTLFAGKISPSDANPISIFYSYLAAPRKLSPRWYLEGLAVFWETWMSGGLGRAMGAYDEMVFRSMVRDSSYIYDVVGLESEGTTIDFQMGVNAYLYGTRFISYLAFTYGPDKILEWTAKTDESSSYFSTEFKRIFGTSLDSEWAKWISFEKEWQAANLNSIRENTTTSFHTISEMALGSVSRSYYDAKTRNLYAAVLYPGQIAHIAAIHIDTGEIEKICEIKDPALYFATSLTYDEQRQKIYFTSDNNSFRDLNVVDIKTGNVKRLMEDVRTGDLAFNKADHSIWGVRHYNGFSTLVRIAKPYSEWNQMYTFPYGEDIFNIDVSPDGKTVTGSLVNISGRAKLIKMNSEDLLNGDTKYEVLFDFDNSLPESFSFSRDGRYLYGSSYYSGVSNIYRYDLQKNDIDIVSNCESGFFRPVEYTQDSLIVMRYTGNGFTPVLIPSERYENVSAIKFLGNEIVKKHPVVKEWMLDPPSSINIDSLIIDKGDYNTFSNIKLTSFYPIVEGYKNQTALGLHFDFSDMIGLTGFELNSSYTPETRLPEKERLHLGLKFHYWEWQVIATYNSADFYDLFGPTKTSRKGYSLGVRYKRNIISDSPESLDMTVNIAGYGGLEKLPDYQKVSATYDKLLSGNLSLDYSNTRSSLGAVDSEKGIRWTLASRGNYVNTQLYPRIYGSFHWGMPLPLDHSSIWLRSSAGHSFGDRNNPFANFFFGGFGNNWVDNLSIKRYREYYSFPGTGLNAFGGKNFAKMMLEWNLPPVRFRRIGIPTFYFRYARFSAFSSLIRTNLDLNKTSDPPLTFGERRTLYNFGGQLDFRIVLFSRLNSTLSFGYAWAGEENQKISNEFMISLKIL